MIKKIIISIVPFFLIKAIRRIRRSMVRTWKVPYSTIGTRISADDIGSVVNVLKMEDIRGNGTFTKEFEKAFSEYVGAMHSLACTNGTTALEIAAKAIGINPGDEVIVSPLTFVATGLAPLSLGAKIKFADIDPSTGNIDIGSLRERITEKTKAVFVVDLYGNPVEIDEIMKIAGENGAYVVEDAAHAIGAAYSCGKVGSKADLTTFSFQSWKNMTTLGEGGMITAKSDELAEKIRMLREFGCVSYGDRKIYEVMKHNPPWYQDFRKVSGHCGTNSRMTEAQAAMGLSQLAKIDKLNGERSRNAKLLRKMLSGIEEIEIPAVKEGIRHSYHIFTILLKTDKVRFSREDLLRELIETERIESYIQYVPIYHFSAFETNPAEANCPNAERFYGRLISLPIHPDLGEKDMTMISKALERSIARLRAAR